MTYTQEQIDGMSRGQITEAVAIKLGYSIHDRQGVFNESSWVRIADGSTRDYTKHPSDYMMIAIEHGISVIMDVNTVYAEVDSSHQFLQSDEYPRTETGLAVCAAFLMMEVDNEPNKAP